jgi:phospholipid transport system substrate-binding protein
MNVPTTTLARPLQALCLLMMAFSAHAGMAPDELVKTTSEEVLGIVRSDPDIAAGDTSKVIDIVEAKVLGHFDFTRMTRLAVGKNWRSANDTQREALTNGFRTLLVRTYAVALAQFRDRNVEYRALDKAPNGPDVMVHTMVATPQGKPINMDYRMGAVGEDWKVYDVLVDGVSLVINYRSQFDATVAEKGIDGLVAMLEEKNAAARAGATQ